MDSCPDPHCQLCGEPAESHRDDAYTQCCNELLCYGQIGPEACTGCREHPPRED